MSKSQLFFVVPVYNEAGNLKRLFSSFQKLAEEFSNLFCVKILLVDDGSKDGTADLAMSLAGNLDLIVLKQEQNMGPGKAFARAFEYLATQYQDTDLVVTMEGDNTSRLELINQMMHRLEEGFDTIFASPYMYGGRILNTSTWRVLLSAIANFFVKELLGINGIMTVSSFFRLYRAKFLKKMQAIYGPEIVERHGFECMTEMTMKMANIRASISEVAMVLDTSARVGKSRMKVWRTIKGYFALYSLREKWLKMAKTPLIRDVEKDQLVNSLLNTPQ
jgi:dolichol-phosphate mannosyltransferase